MTGDIEGNDDEFVFAGTSFFGVMNGQTGKHRVLKSFWTSDPEAETKSKRCRGNDGNVDPSGRYVDLCLLDAVKSRFDLAGLPADSY